MSAKIDVVGEVVAQAVVAADVAFGGDIMAPSGLHRVIGDAYYMHRPLPNVYNHDLASQIREKAKRGEDVDDLAARWLKQDNVDEALHALQDTAEGVDAKYRRLYLLNLLRALRSLVDMRKMELDLGPRVDFFKTVESGVGQKPSIADLKPHQEKMMTLLVEAGYDPDKYEKLHLAVDAWAKDRKIHTGEGIKSIILALLDPLESEVRQRILAHLPSQLRDINIANVTITGLPEATFGASSNYWGHKGDYQGNYEYNMKILKTEVELKALSMHEFLPGHHFCSVLRDAMVGLGVIGAEAGISTMGTPETAFAEGVAVAAPRILYEADEWKSLDVHQRIAFTREELSNLGRQNICYLHYVEGKDEAHMEQYLREEGCDNAEASARVPKWTRNPMAGMVYLPAYGIGPQVVWDSLNRYRRTELLKVIYGVYGAVDLALFPTIAAEQCDRA